jgi:hypothetical protein
MGAAYLDGMLFRGTDDGRVLARRLDVAQAGEALPLTYVGSAVVVGKIKAVKVSVFRRHRHEPLASCCLDESRWVGDVPVVPISGRKLEMVLVSAGLGVEDDERALHHNQASLEGRQSPGVVGT